MSLNCFLDPCVFLKATTTTLEGKGKKVSIEIRESNVPFSSLDREQKMKTTLLEKNA